MKIEFLAKALENLKAPPVCIDNGFYYCCQKYKFENARKNKDEISGNFCMTTEKHLMNSTDISKIMTEFPLKNQCISRTP